MINTRGSQGLNFPNTDFSGEDLSHMKITKGLFINADLSDSDLRFSDFEKTRFSGALFRGANLSNASFTEAKMDGVDLTGANLQKAQLYKCDLKNACLRKADLMRELSTITASHNRAFEFLNEIIESEPDKIMLDDDCIVVVGHLATYRIKIDNLLKRLSNPIVYGLGFDTISVHSKGKLDREKL